MKQFLVCLALTLFVSTARAAVPMLRVADVRDSRTITVEADGTVSVVILRAVDVPPSEEAQAISYLRQALAGRWMYVEEGEVYRSPDGLHINREMRRRSWLKYTWLGPVDPAPRSDDRRVVATQKARPSKEPSARKPRASGSRRRRSRP